MARARRYPTDEDHFPLPTPPSAPKTLHRPLPKPISVSSSLGEGARLGAVGHADVRRVGGLALVVHEDVREQVLQGRGGAGLGLHTKTPAQEDISALAFCLLPWVSLARIYD